MFVAHAVFDLFSVELPQQEGAAGASPPDKALDTVVEHLVVEAEAADVLLCLIGLPHTAYRSIAADSDSRPPVPIYSWVT